MANKNTTRSTAEPLASALTTEAASKLPTSSSASSENQNNNNPRYSLGGARASLGPVKAGRLSNAGVEFGDAQGKLSLSGRQSLSATQEGRLSLSR